MAITYEDVTAINGGTGDETSLAPFISAAESIIGEGAVASCIAAKGLSTAVIDAATAWLTAHLFSLTPGGQESATVKTTRFEGYTVERVVGMYDQGGLLATPYGQTANSILQGCLSATGKRPAEIGFFG